MKQLELQYYTKQELCEIFDIDGANKNSARDIKNILAKCGYEHTKWSCKGITITKKPESAEEKLSELFIREFNIDVRTNIYGMACFLVMLGCYEDFQSMPWSVRAEELFKEYQVRVDEKTLRNWFNKLEKRDLVVKFRSEKTTWLSFYVDGEIYREMVTGNEDAERQARQYFKKRNQYVREYRQRELFENNREDIHKINSEAWSFAHKMLWDEFHCCFYTCFSVYLNAIGEYAQEIFELVEEISGFKYKY